MALHPHHHLRQPEDDQLPFALRLYAMEEQMEMERARATRVIAKSIVFVALCLALLALLTNACLLILMDPACPDESTGSGGSNSSNNSCPITYRSPPPQPEEILIGRRPTFVFTSDGSLIMESETLGKFNRLSLPPPSSFRHATEMFDPPGREMKSLVAQIADSPIQVFRSPKALHSATEEDVLHIYDDQDGLLKSKNYFTSPSCPTKYELLVPAAENSTKFAAICDRNLVLFQRKPAPPIDDEQLDFENGNAEMSIQLLNVSKVVPNLAGSFGSWSGDADKIAYFVPLHERNSLAVVIFNTETEKAVEILPPRLEIRGGVGDEDEANGEISILLIRWQKHGELVVVWKFPEELVAVRCRRKCRLLSTIHFAAGDTKIDDALFVGDQLVISLQNGTMFAANVSTTDGSMKQVLVKENVTKLVGALHRSIYIVGSDVNGFPQLYGLTLDSINNSLPTQTTCISCQLDDCFYVISEEISRAEFPSSRLRASPSFVVACRQSDAKFVAYFHIDEKVEESALERQSIKIVQETPIDVRVERLPEDLGYLLERDTDGPENGPILMTTRKLAFEIELLRYLISATNATIVIVNGDASSARIAQTFNDSRKEVIPIIDDHQSFELFRSALASSSSSSPLFDTLILHNLVDVDIDDVFASATIRRVLLLYDSEKAPERRRMAAHFGRFPNAVVTSVAIEPHSHCDRRLHFAPVARFVRGE